VPGPLTLCLMRILVIALLLLGGCSHEAALAPGQAAFRDCEVCPLMVDIPPGEFLMGTAPEDRLVDPRTGEPATNDGPQHRVRISRPFAIGRYEVTVGEYSAFVADTGYESAGKCMGFAEPNRFTMSDRFNWQSIDGEQGDRHPVTCVSWDDATAYADWLSRRTGETYRLPSEAEWEYAARAGSVGNYHWGTDAGSACRYANVRSPGAQSISDRQARSDADDGFPCDDGYPAASPVGSFQPNDFGLYDMQGNAWEWVADCNHADYEGAPADGSAWVDDEGCQFGLIRSGSFLNRVERSSATVRVGRPRSGRGTNMGFRVLRGAPVGGDVAAERLAASDAQWNDGSPGALLFNDNCLDCHQQRNNFRGTYGTDQAAVEAVIRDGGNNVMSMPTFKDVLTPAQTTTLARYIRDANGW
jgi:sulfatase modifying factor 1